MTDPERDHLLRQVRELEAGVRRWKVFAAGLAVCLALLVAVGGLSGIFFAGRAAVAREQELRAVEAERRAREQAEAQRRQAEQARQKAQGQPGNKP